MIEETSDSYEQCEAECIALAHKWHAMGIGMVIAMESFNPKTDGTRYTYTTAGTFMGCLGLATWLKKKMLSCTDGVDEDEDEDSI